MLYGHVFEIELGHEYSGICTLYVNDDDFFDDGELDLNIFVSSALNADHAINVSVSHEDSVAFADVSEIQTASVSTSASTSTSTSTTATASASDYYDLESSLPVAIPSDSSSLTRFEMPLITVHRDYIHPILSARSFRLSGSRINNQSLFSLGRVPQKLMSFLKSRAGIRLFACLLIGFGYLFIESYI